MIRTLSQNKQLWGLLNKLNYNRGEVDNQVLSFTNGRTYESKEMTMEECSAYIGWLNTQLDI